jgi:hypothetical protein
MVVTRYNGERQDGKSNRLIARRVNCGGNHYKCAGFCKPANPIGCQGEVILRSKHSEERDLASLEFFENVSLSTPPRTGPNRFGIKADRRWPR